MSPTCSNCSRPITANFCTNCGQKKYKRIDRKYILDEVQYTVLHTNKGFLYSVKNLIKNPGKTANDYIHGNRVNHYKPILLTFVLSGISTFISFKIVGLNHIIPQMFEAQPPVMANYQSFITTYTTFLMLTLIPLFALGSWISFKNWGYNYYEHIVFNAYQLSFYTLVNIVLVYPLMYLFKDNIQSISILFLLSFLCLPLISGWFFRELYKGKSLNNVMIRVFTSLILSGTLYIALIFISMFIYLGYIAIDNPEVFKQFQPK